MRIDHILARGAWLLGGLAVAMFAAAVSGQEASNSQTASRAPQAQQGMDAMHAGHDHGAAVCLSLDLECATAATPLLLPNGTLWLVWTANGTVSIARSSDHGRSFGPRTTLAEHGKSLDGGADARPQLVSNGDGHLLVAYGFFKDTHWNAQVNLVRSDDDGKSFTAPYALSSDPVSQRFPALNVAPDGQIFAAWLDKRLIAAARKSGEEREGAAIAFAWSGDDGRSFRGERIAHGESCECCRIAANLTPAGLPVLLYRAIFDEGQERDHALQVFSSRETPGQVARVAADHWRTHTCPHHGPALAVSASGAIEAAWFTQGSARQGVFLARSIDQGKQFSAPVALLDPDRPESHSGRPALLALGHHVWLAWKAFDGKEARILVEHSGDDGATWSAPAVVASASGYTDHPMLLADRGHPFLSWLTRTQGYKLLALDSGS